MDLTQAHKVVSDIDAHVDNHLEKVAGLDAGKLPNLCTVWSGVKPVIKFARALLFWKPKWQAVIDQFITSLDAACNETN